MSENLSSTGHDRSTAQADGADTAETVRARVREGYAEIARKGSTAGGGSCCGPSCCSGEGSGSVALAVGYTPEELARIPEGADMGLSCGNPTALAALRPGETVVDLGSGGGFDVFQAGYRVGAGGRVIGVDMTPDMLTRARRNAARYREQSGLDNVEFRLGEIEHLPVADGIVDVVLSNCVVNLSPDKRQVWRDMFRVLKPGGRVAISDIALLRTLPDGVRDAVEALVGCVAGAVPVEETRAMAEAAGFTAIELEPRPDYVRAMTDFADPLYQRIAAGLPPGTTAADFLTSLSIRAVKPA